MKNLLKIVLIVIVAAAVGTGTYKITARHDKNQSLKSEIKSERESKHSKECHSSRNVSKSVNINGQSLTAEEQSNINFATDNGKYGDYTTNKYHLKGETNNNSNNQNTNLVNPYNTANQTFGGYSDIHQMWNAGYHSVYTLLMDKYGYTEQQAKEYVNQHFDEISKFMGSGDLQTHAGF